MSRRTVIDPRLLPYGAPEAVEVFEQLARLGHTAVVECADDALLEYVAAQLARLGVRADLTRAVPRCPVNPAAR